MSKKQATRNNKGKLRWTLIDYSVLEEMLKVLEGGANAYGVENWKKGLHREEILESIQRHLVSLIKKIETDPQFGAHHVGHIMANCMFYFYHHQNNTFSEKRNNPFLKQ